jgi:rRNA maturation endonuclease Nob1
MNVLALRIEEMETKHCEQCGAELKRETEEKEAHEQIRECLLRYYE